MARPSKTAAIDYTRAHDLTHGLLDRATCPTDRPFVLVKDADKKGLRLRVTKAGGKHWQFETRLRSGRLFTRALGEWPTISIADARSEAHQLRGQTEQGTDPRVLEREQAAAVAATVAAAVAQALTVGEVWPLYLATGKPKRRDAWKPRYRTDLEAMAAPGGVEKKRGKGLTRPGPLFPLLALPLAGVNEDSLKSWFDSEALKGKHQATRALMMFRGFLRWCSARPEYRKLTDREAGRAAAIVECLPSNSRRTDALEAAQVLGWWTGVEQLSNRTASVYLRALLLTGARREELAALTWANVDFQWRKMTIADKVEDTRTIPLTPYLAQLLATLPRTNEHVFASTGKAGRIADTRASHAKALKSASIEGLTIHGLRRSFSLLGEAADAPAGAIAQVMGHKPSATAEGYRPRSTDALRPFHDQIEAHILALAGVTFDPKAEPCKLRMVA
ncbi:MAG: integrase [Burkholderiales bacterium]|nr:MAG: integrase [Burkholderiales bacterium]